MRIVSLLASATEIVCALGCGDQLVGRSHECDNPAWVRQLPCCSDATFDITASSAAVDAEVRRRLHTGEPLYQIDNALIESLRPDLILTQVHCDVCAVTAADLDRSEAGVHASVASTRQVALSASTLADIFAGIRQVAGALDVPERGEALIDHEQQRLNTVRERTAHLPRKTVAMIEWTDPIFLMANWAPELVEIANGHPVLSRAGEYSFATDGERVLAADPDYVIVAPCGFSLERTLQEQSRLEQYPWWPRLRAVQNGRVAYADGNRLFNRSGTTIADTAEIIAQILHGISFDTTPGPHWRLCQPLDSHFATSPAG